MFNKFAVLVFAILFMAGRSYAQLPCSTDEHYRKLLAQYPQLAQYEEQFNEQLERHIAARTTLVVDTNTYDIPIVVHVVHDYGDENVSDNAIFDAATYWASIYMKQNPDTADVITPFVRYVGNPKMRLHLATKDPNGNPTKGIVRVQSYLTSNADDQAKYNQWNQRNYINIWLIGTFGAEDIGVAAYAILPGTVMFEPYYDGIICLSSYTDNTTKTIPHELGHVLNLQHPWGNTNNPGVACGDDHVDDTPPTKGHLPSGCTDAALYDTTCATGYHKTYASVGSSTPDSLVDYPDTVNSQNIMDYTYCQKMFSKGQAARMRTSLTAATAGRNHLYAPGNLDSTGALAPRPELLPIADFVVNNRSVGSGIATHNDNRQYFLAVNSTTNFQFANESWNDTITNVSWSFTNGATNPTSTSMTTVNNKFSVPGWVTVSLTANSNAGSNTLTNTQAVYAADTAPVGSRGYAQYFASAGDISNWPMFNYYNNQFKWDFFTGAGAGDNTCLRYHSFDTSARRFGCALGDHDDIYTPAFDLASYTTGDLYLDLFTAGAVTKHGVTNGVYAPTMLHGDSLEISASINGGVNWNKIAYFSSHDLANNDTVSTDFVPTSASQWVARTISIPVAYRAHNTYFRLRYRPGTLGNNLYLDNFVIDQFPAGVREAMTSQSSFSIFPNPANNGCTLMFKTGNNGEVFYTIKDVTGKLVYQAKKEFAANTIGQETIARSVTPSAGLYFVTAVIDGVSTTQKLVVY